MIFECVFMKKKKKKPDGKLEKRNSERFDT